MKKNISKEYLILIGLIFFLALPGIVLGFELQLDYPEILGKDLNEIINLPSEQQLSNFVLYLYYFFLSIAGIAAFVMIVWGGMSYLTSTGKPATINEAKDRIFKAFLGLAILLASYLILNTISPELVLLKPPGIEVPGLIPGVIIETGEVPAGCKLGLDNEGNPTKYFMCSDSECRPCENEELLWINNQWYVVCCEEGGEGTSEECPYLVGNEKVCLDDKFKRFDAEPYEEDYWLCCEKKCEALPGCRVVETENCWEGFFPCDRETEVSPLPGCEFIEGKGCWTCCPKDYIMPGPEACYAGGAPDPNPNCNNGQVSCPFGYPICKQQPDDYWECCNY